MFTSKIFPEITKCKICFCLGSKIFFKWLITLVTTKIVFGTFASHFESFDSKTIFYVKI